MSELLFPPPHAATSAVISETSLVIDDPPPISINKAYTVFRGRTGLSSAGRKYKDAVRQQVAQASFEWKLAWDAVYRDGGFVELHMTFYLPLLQNGSWVPGGVMTKPRKRKDGTRPKPQARAPYQQIDVGNFLKLLEDGIVSGCGVDDAAHLDIHLYKREDIEHPRIEILHRTLIYV